MESFSPLFDRVRQEEDIFVKASYIKDLAKKKHVPVVSIARELKSAPSYICGLIRLCRIPTLVRDGYYAKHLTLSHMLVMSRLKNEKDIIKTFEQILSHNLTVRDTETKVRELLYQIKTQGERIGTSYQDALEKKYQTLDQDASVSITQTRIKTHVVITLKGDRKKTSEFIQKLADEE